jgi:formylglycine-generating enzyme required for sulfatase activity
VLLAETALGLGDLSLAQANLDCLSILTHVSLHTLLKEKKKEVEEERRRSRRNRFALLTLSLFLVLGLIVGNVIVRAEREVAKNRLQEIEELSGIQLYQELVDLESTLWPAIPEQSKFMQEWLRTAKELVSSLPKHEEHLRILSIKRDGIRFDKSAQRWEYETLRRLVKGLNHLNSTLIPTVELRMKEANTLVKRSILRHQEKWDEAIEKIALSDRYDGLVLKEQEGLTPLGRNEQGLWEFAHLLSGEIPKKNKKGAWEITEETGLVLVLLPAGQFLMGASSMEGAQNFDPRAADIEGPVHEISLDGFFLSKYELTQAQWLRVQSTNPSAYLPGQEQGGYTINQIHPVEHMTWLEAKNTLDRLDLVLPTEAQWEYGNRAGTQTIYWGGDEIADMRGKINISDRVAREKGSPASWKFEMELDDGFTVHAPVGSLLPNNFGLHDTSGNVWEWCLDLFGAYTQPVDSKRGIRTVEVGEARRIFRGGGFRASSVHARSADRYSIYARDYSAYDVGIRPARLLNP